MSNPAYCATADLYSQACAQELIMRSNEIIRTNNILSSQGFVKFPTISRINTIVSRLLVITPNALYSDPVLNSRLYNYIPGIFPALNTIKLFAHTQPTLNTINIDILINKFLKLDGELKNIGMADLARRQGW